MDLGMREGMVTCRCLNTLEPWHNPDMYHRGVQLGLKVIMTDTSLSGWGALCDGIPASERFLESERQRFS